MDDACERHAGREKYRDGRQRPVRAAKVSRRGDRGDGRSPPKQKPGPLWNREPGHLGNSGQGSVSRDDWSFSERKLADRSFANRSSNRRRLFARQIGRKSAADHRDGRDSGKKKLKQGPLPCVGYKGSENTMKGAANLFN